jgi:uncharacterized membrane protein YoaK (UPF0700 family)
MAIESNPYESPSSEKPKPSATGSTPRSILSVICGGIFVDYIGSHIILGVSFLIILGYNGWDEAQLREWSVSDTASYLGKAIGVFSSFFGALVASRLAKRAELAHAICSVALAVAVSIPSMLQRGLHKQPLSWLVVVGCFVVASYAATISQKKRLSCEAAT